VKNIQVLEEKISKVIDKIKTLTEENKALNGNVSGLQEELAQKDEALKIVNADLGVVDELKTEIENLNKERDTVRSQIENLLKELESVEL
jgi:chromosome segregation ATPase